jgi:hypothetical protein
MCSISIKQIKTCHLVNNETIITQHQTHFRPSVLKGGGSRWGRSGDSLNSTIPTRLIVPLSGMIQLQCMSRDCKLFAWYFKNSLYENFIKQRIMLKIRNSSFEQRNIALHDRSSIADLCPLFSLSCHGFKFFEVETKDLTDYWLTSEVSPCCREPSRKFCSGASRFEQ